MPKSQRVDKQLEAFQTAKHANQRRSPLVPLFVSAAVAQSPSDVPVFKVTPVKSTIKFGVKASVPIEGTFDKWDATLTFTSPEAQSAVLDVKIQASSVNTGSGMKDGKLKSKDFFDVGQAPNIALVVKLRDEFIYGERKAVVSC